MRLDSRPRFGVRHCCAAFPSCRLRFLCSSLLRASLPNRLLDFGDSFVARFGAEVALAVDADADGVRFHVAFPDDEHGVHFHLFGALDFAVDLIGAFVDFRPHLICAQFIQNRSTHRRSG